MLSHIVTQLSLSWGWGSHLEWHRVGRVKTRALFRPHCRGVQCFIEQPGSSGQHSNLLLTGWYQRSGWKVQ